MGKENMDQDIDVLAGFKEMADYIAKPIGGDDDIDDPKYDIIDPADLEGNQHKNDDSNDDLFNDEDDNQDDIDNDNQDDNDDNDDSDDITSGQNNQDNDSDDIDSQDDEVDMISPFVDLFAEELGWELDDEDKPKTIKDLVGLMDNIISENSKPKYYSDEIQALDEFVRNGGNIQEYFEESNKAVSLDSIDLSKESNQKRVIKEHLKSLNYSDDRIEKRLERFEESGILEEEAEESLEFLKDASEKNKQKLLKEQQKQYEMQLQKQQEFVSNVESTIKQTDSIFGVQLNTAQKKELIDRLLKVDAQGRTKYQVEYQKDPVQGLIESAFVQMNKKELLNMINKKAKNDAVSNFKDKLRKKQSSNRAKDMRGYRSKGGYSDLISSVSSQLTR